MPSFSLSPKARDLFQGLFYLAFICLVLPLHASASIGCKTPVLDAPLELPLPLPPVISQALQAIDTLLDREVNRFGVAPDVTVGITYNQQTIFSKGS